MRQLKKYSARDLKQLAYLLLVPGLKLIYLVINRIPRPATNMLIAADSYIPVLPAFVLPYMLFYPFVLGGLVYLFGSNREAYMHTALSYSVGLMICYITYLLYQTTVPRPELLGNDLFTNLLRYIYSIDRPYNCLPSIHVLGTMLIMLGGKRQEGEKGHNMLRLVFNSLGVLIIISTLFTKQHGILDVLAGLLLGGGVYYVVGRYLKVHPEVQPSRVLMN